MELILLNLRCSSRIKNFFRHFILSNIFESCCLIAGQQLYLTNFKHYLTKGKTPALGWHRDTYYRKNKFTGLIPTGYKLAIYTKNVTETDGCTAFVKGSHRIDFNNKYFDYFLTYFSNKIRKVELDKGDAVLFNVNLIHNRLKASNFNSIRAVTIYGFALSNHYQEKYLNDNNGKIIDYFNSELKKKNFMTTLITGCAGFVGYHLTKSIISKNKSSKIIGIDNMNSYYDVKLKRARKKI